MKRTTGNSAVTDPVCGMNVHPAQAAATSVADGATYYFCAQSCKMTFDRDPHSFIEREQLAEACCGHGCCSA